ncbi:FAD-dependent oxidoreductase [Streptomyces sp. NPDC090054]|uniref:FAD-dependent oxidoreductase n=1 Tax=Streptomyces sp. NPDC090054 TaxID=3365933 RepID=UPI0038211349
MTNPGNTRTTTSAPRRAIVIGAGITGMLAAVALREVTDEVLIVENDELPDGPLPRKGLPQARHAHSFWSGGVLAAETLLPGVTDRWMAAGARRIPIPTGMVGFSSEGWFRRWNSETHFILACSRDLLDSVVRDFVLEAGRVSIRQRTRVEGLTGSAAGVTGVRVRGADGREEDLEADFVIDASGRGSRTPRHLQELGVGSAPERSLDLGLVYATRLFRAPEGAGDFPIVSVQSDARLAGPGQGASILPIEDNKWLVTALGTRGGEPTGAVEDFEPFTRGLRHPLVGEIISHLEPLTGVAINRSTRNTRRYFEHLKNWPERFVVMGDALAAFNPTYGHGMSVGAQSALALKNVLSANDVNTPHLSRRIQKAVAKPVAAAWDLALGQDVFYPQVRGGAPSRRDRILATYVHRLLKTSCGNFTMVRDFTDVTSLQAPLTTLVKPRVLLAAARGPLHPPLSGPPLTERELGLVTARGCRPADSDPPRSPAEQEQSSREPERSATTVGAARIHPDSEGIRP